MSDTVLVVAPHPDDESLGCGGTIGHHRGQGDRVVWCIATQMTEAYPPERRAQRAQEIEAVSKHHGFDKVERLGWPTAELDRIPTSTMVQAFGGVIARHQPAVVYLPFAGDAHSDHRRVAETAGAALKWFRALSTRRVLAYETPSETGFKLQPTAAFRPTVYVDVTAHLPYKLAAAGLYAGELGVHPFPRSEQAITALAQWRGAEVGCGAAEAFMLLREVIQ